MDKNGKLYAYIVTNSSYTGWIKLGRTINLKKRISDYQTCSPYRNYKYEWYKEVTTSQMRLIENHFSINVRSNGCEWFRCDVKDAILIINNLLMA